MTGDQANFALGVGATSPPLRTHSKAEIAACGSMGGAVQLALIHAHMTQEQLAGRLGISDGYLCMCMSGKRRWPEIVLRQIVRLTGSLAPVQWTCAQFGGEFYADPVEQKRALLKRELAELEARAA